MKTKNILTIVLAISATLLFNSCDEDGIFGKAIYNITVINNTADVLNIYESEEGGDFHKIGEVEANASVREKGFIIDKEYKLEARKDDGTIVASRVFEQDKDTNLTWTIE